MPVGNGKTGISTIIRGCCFDVGATADCGSFCRIVTAFAKAIGEFHTLSRVDLHLLALTHSLEVASHGDKHVRQTPPPPRTTSKHQSGPDLLPGWGSQGDDWAELDALGDSEASTSVLQGIGGHTKLLLSGDIEQTRTSSGPVRSSKRDGLEQIGQNRWFCCELLAGTGDSVICRRSGGVQDISQSSKSSSHKRKSTDIGRLGVVLACFSMSWCKFTNDAATVASPFSA